MSQLHTPIQELLINTKNKDKGALSLRDLLDAEANYLKIMNTFLNQFLGSEHLTLSATEINRDQMITIQLTTNGTKPSKLGKFKVSEALLQQATNGEEDSLNQLTHHLENLTN
ncbi:hypothetical protein RCJ22_13375 [Vibrio sp. FNV 38]|nr:hypothetical protein [Vibrio sp. FNV 38]